MTINVYVQVQYKEMTVGKDMYHVNKLYAYGTFNSVTRSSKDRVR